MMHPLIPMALLLAVTSITYAEDLTVLTETPDGIPPGKQFDRPFLRRNADGRCEVMGTVSCRIPNYA